MDVPAVEGRVALAASFAGAARRYWLGVFPRVCVERRRRRARALEIPDQLLRATALDAQRKWGNVEGAAAFAAFVPLRHRAAAARAMTCYQAAYNYLDMLGEQPSADPAANGRRLHSALLVALDPDPGGTPHLDYYEHHPQRDDGGYLTEMLDTCRAALATLPSYSVLAPAARRAAERIVAFQSCNTGELQGDLQALERWARAETPPESDLRWWETAAAAGSSLCVYALIALAAEPDLAVSLECGCRGGTGRARTPIFPGLERCTRCSTTSLTPPRIALPDNTASSAATPRPKKPPRACAGWPNARYTPRGLSQMLARTRSCWRRWRASTCQLRRPPRPRRSRSPGPC